MMRFSNVTSSFRFSIPDPTNFPNSTQAMNLMTLELRDLPADVQDILRDRAIRERKPIGDVIAAYVLEVAKAIVAAAAKQQAA